MTAPPHAVPPETGSASGVRLHAGAFARRAGLPVPAGYAEGALYSVYPRAFSPEGTLRAVIPRLDALRDLGVSALWLLPIHPVGVEGRKGSRGSPYAVRDDGAVAPELGSADDLRRLVDEAHRRGLRVLIDFVANHAALDHVRLRDRPEWFARDEAGRPTRRTAEWSDVVDRHHGAPGLRDYLVESALRWVRDLGVDGFRCDVAGMVPAAFWSDLHAALVSARPDHLLLAEWQDPAFHTTAFHASYDWILYRALRDTARGRADARAVGAALRSWTVNFPSEAVPLRFLENHDEPRANEVVGAARLPAYAAVTFLSGGWPLLYAGQEIGASHRPSLFEAEPVDWRAADPGITALYRGLLEARRRVPWGLGPARPLETDRPKDAVAFLRGEDARLGLVVANLGRSRTRVAPALPGDVRFRRILGSSGTLAAGGAVDLETGEAWIGETP